MLGLVVLLPITATVLALPPLCTCPLSAAVHVQSMQGQHEFCRCSLPLAAVKVGQQVEAPALLAEALGDAVLEQAAQLQVLLADAVALVVHLGMAQVLAAVLDLPAKAGCDTPEWPCCRCCWSAWHCICLPRTRLPCMLMVCCLYVLFASLVCLLVCLALATAIPACHSPSSPFLLPAAAFHLLRTDS